MAIRLSFMIARLIGKYHASKMSCEFALLRLPTELIALVVEHIESLKTLRSLASTCRRLQDITERVLYRSIRIRDRVTAEHVLRSFNARKARATALRLLDVPCKDRVGPDFAALAAVLAKAKNLSEIMFESPECHSSNWEPEDEWREMTDHLFHPFQLSSSLLTTPGPALTDRPLQRLTKLTINMNGGGSPYWSLDRRSLALLRHPSLQELEISCVNIPTSLDVSDQPKFATPLKRLHLIECNITTKGLASILQLPEALEHLYLGENCHNIRQFGEYVDPSCNHLFKRNSGATLVALSHQKSSLTSLSYATTPTYHQNRQLLFAARCTPPVHGGFAKFTQLEHIHLVGQCPNFERAVMSSSAPPNLRSLHFEGYFEMPTEFEHSCVTTAPFLRVPSVHIPSTLKALDFTIDAIHFHDDVPLPEFARAKIIHAHGVCAKFGVALRVFYRPHSTYYPPYLNGEPKPVSELVYDGGEGFLGRFAWDDIPSDEETSDSEYEPTEADD